MKAALLRSIKMEVSVLKANYENNNCLKLDSEDVLELSSSAIKKFHYHEKLLQRKNGKNYCEVGGEEMRRFAHQILTKQLKVILGFESGKRWKE